MVATRSLLKYYGRSTLRYPPRVPDATLVGAYDQCGPFWTTSARTTRAVNEADPVGAWDDLSGNNNHWLQAGAGFRPLLSLAQLGGMAALLFDGVDDFLANTLARIQPCFALVVAKKTGTLANNTYILDDNTLGNLNVLGSPDAATIRAYCGTILDVPTTPGNWHIYHAGYNVGVGAGLLSVDGTETAGSVGGGVPTSSCVGRYGGNANYWAGYIATIFLYAGIPGLSSRSKIARSTGRRNGLAVA